MIRFSLLLRCNSANSNKFNIKLVKQAQSQKSFSTKKSSSSSSSDDERKKPSGIKGNEALPQKSFSTKQSSSSSSSSSTSSDDERKKSASKNRSEEAREKLNLLLNRMIKEDVASKTQPKLELAKPKDRRQKSVPTEPGTESVKTEPVERQIVKAAKDVAKSIGGDAKQTESELLHKLLNSVKEEPAQTTTSNLSEIFKDMKIDREVRAGEDISRAQQVRQLLQAAKSKQQQPGRPKAGVRRSPRHHVSEEEREMQLIEERVDLFGADRLGIFPSLEEIEKWDKLELNKTWKALHERELQLAVTHPPANHFQQMILWTQQKKLWRFPIDNEQDLEKEKSVYFAEHVFLEKHLEPWCPPKGPIRHFMELVCVGLSKNSYLTVEKKKEHIEWFRNYFNEKQQILREVGAITPDFDIGKETTKKIEG